MMGENNNKSFFTYSDIMQMFKNTLKTIDERLVCHGDRVAYIIYEIVKEGNLYKKFDYRKLMLLAEFHDVGSYRTDEIDRIMSIHNTNVFDHSIYGYVFLKNMTFLNEYAETVLFHHLKYKDLIFASTKYKDYAALIYFADRVDIILHKKGSSYDFSYLKKFVPDVFCPEYVDLFLRVNEKRNIVKRIENNEYLKDMQSAYDKVKIPHKDAEEFLKMIIYIIDFRSHCTVTHTVKTSYISLQLAKLLKMSDVMQQEVFYGAFLHDIGKIAIPTRILESPGKLNEEEMKIMSTHVDFTEKILRGVISDKICNIAVRHHEKLDGSGYPNHLTDKDLTMQEKVVAVADIVSALSDQRSYKTAFPKEETIEITKKMDAEGKLSPKACSVLVDNYDEIMKDTQEHSRATLELYKTITLEYKRLKENFFWM